MKLSGEVEFILVCAKSNDLTPENAFKIKAEYKDLNIAIEQSSKVTLVLYMKQL